MSDSDRITKLETQITILSKEINRLRADKENLLKRGLWTLLSLLGAASFYIWRQHLG